jgi:sugar/nucleoside kinase (ribokinase family)
MRSDGKLDVIVAGDVNADLILTEVPPLEAGKEKLARDMELILGGSSAITAFNLARLGLKVGFVGVVGDDFLGRFCEEKLRSAGVDVTCLHRSRRRKSGLTIWMSRHGRRAGVTYPGTIHALRASDVPAGYLERARHLHVGAYFLQNGLHSGAPALFRRAQRLGLTTSLDCNWDPSETWDSGIREVLPFTDVFFPNEDEARRLAAKRDVRRAAEELGRLARIVVVKRGAKGVYVHSPEGAFEVPAVRARVVDTTGAGDAFNAGFLSRFVRGAPLGECARAGVEAGARAVSRVGGTAAFEES